MTGGKRLEERPCKTGGDNRRDSPPPLVTGIIHQIISGRSSPTAQKNCQKTRGDQQTAGTYDNRKNTGNHAPETVTEAPTVFGSKQGSAGAMNTESGSEIDPFLALSGDELEDRVA